MGDVLRADPCDLFDLLKELYKWLPDSCTVYCNVLSQISVPTDKAHIYFARSPDGRCTAAIGIKAETFRDVKHLNLRTCWIINEWAVDDCQLTKIYSALDIIDWNKDALKIFGRGYQISQNMSDFLVGKGMAVTNYTVDRYVIEPPVALDCQGQVPTNTYIKNLEQCHAQTVYDFWPYRAQSSVEWVADEIQRLPSAGLFLKENDQLVSWVISAFPDSLGKLHTLEQYRRRGYAKLVVEYLSKHLAMAGYRPFANILVANEASKRTFESIGYQFHSQGHITLVSAIN